MSVDLCAFLTYEFAPETVPSLGLKGRRQDPEAMDLEGGHPPSADSSSGETVQHQARKVAAARLDHVRRHH